MLKNLEVVAPKRSYELIHKMDNFNCNLKRPKQIQNETCIKKLVQEFTELSLDRQRDISLLVNYCEKFALYNNDVQYFEEPESISDSSYLHENSDISEPSFTSQLYMSSDL